jgi:EAL domain-containing protein (putative c-di-GMP-specific phosphodiesterase class I)
VAFYSSFQYLRSLPVDKVKIDQAFVRRMAVDSSDAAIVRAMVTVARSLSLEIIAEGIETVAQRDFLRDEGCPIGQGYLFSLPLPAEEFRGLLERKVVLPLSENLL